MHCNWKTNNLSSLRDWLLPMLMNGQVKVDSQSRDKSEFSYATDLVPGEFLPLAAEAGETYAAKPEG